MITPSTRRGFLSSLFKGAVIAAVAPQIVTHGLKLVRPRTVEVWPSGMGELLAQMSPIEELYDLNPDWVNAPFEETLIFGSELRMVNGKMERFAADYEPFPNPFPNRSLTLEDAHKWIFVPPLRCRRRQPI